VTSALAITEARATIATGSKSFALASRVLPRRVRDQAAIVYTWCRRADDAIDLAPPAAQPAALAALRADLDAVSAGAATGPQLAAFASVIRDRAIPRAYPDALLDGMAMDAAGATYLRVEELLGYCWRVAGVVGLMMSHVMGVTRDDALVPAAHLGVAMQITNVCRDVAEDWRLGRLYVPDEVLARHGAGGLAIELGRPMPRSAVAPLAGAVAELLALADRHYRAARPGFAALPWRCALAVRAAASIYRAIGARIAARGHRVTAGRAVVSTPRKLALLAGAAVRTGAGLRPGRRARPPTLVLEARDVPAL
jgi:phytoene synthase